MTKTNNEKDILKKNTKSDEGKQKRPLPHHILSPKQSHNPFLLLKRKLPF